MNNTAGQTPVRREPLESDWKKFSRMVPYLRERYLTEQNASIIRLLSDKSKDETDRFWSAEKKIRDVAWILRKCLDGHSRSRMYLFMRTMLNVGMLKREDLVDFSADIRWLLLDEREVDKENN